jgi:hypothetical protein
MKPTPLTLMSLAAGLTAAAAIGAEPAPKLVPRPLPGLGVVQPLPSAGPAAVSAARPKATASAPGAAAEAENRARVLFIHRRDSLPSELTANLPKADPDAHVKAGGNSILVPARSGKVRIIPKAAVPALLARTPEEKPSTPVEP